MLQQAIHNLISGTGNKTIAPPPPESLSIDAYVRHSSTVGESVPKIFGPRYSLYWNLYQQLFSTGFKIVSQSNSRHLQSIVAVSTTNHGAYVIMLFSCIKGI